MAKTQTAATLVASAAKAAATVTRGRWDVSAADGGVLTMLITNGATAPTNAGGVVGRVLIGHYAVGGMPAAGGPGADWKLTNVQISGGSVNNAATALMFRFGPEIAYIEVEFLAHTGNDVTVEAYGTSYTNA